MDKSTHRVEVIPVVLESHPNADRLEIARIWNYTSCVQKGQFKDGDLAAYIPPDSVVDTTRPEFAFLKKDGRDRERIRVKKLRGIISMGLLMPAPEGSEVGQDVAEAMGIVHYEPPDTTTGGENVSPPPGYHPNYDVDTLYRYVHLFQEGEQVIATEKIHGANGRWVCIDGQMYCGSRNLWKKEDDKSVWWRALRRNPEVERFCREHPDMTVYGEVYGWVQSLRYGKNPGEVDIAVFDLLRGTEWIAVEAARKMAPDLPWVPIVYAMPFHAETIFESADGPSLIPNAHHEREGIVVKPLTERIDPEIGRVQLKVVSNSYLEKA